MTLYCELFKNCFIIIYASFLTLLMMFHIYCDHHSYTVYCSCIFKRDDNKKIENEYSRKVINYA